MVVRIPPLRDPARQNRAGKGRVALVGMTSCLVGADG